MGSGHDIAEGRGVPLDDLIRLGVLPDGDRRDSGTRIRGGPVDEDGGALKRVPAPWAEDRHGRTLRVHEGVRRSVEPRRAKHDVHPQGAWPIRDPGEEVGCPRARVNPGPIVNLNLGRIRRRRRDAPRQEDGSGRKDRPRGRADHADLGRLRGHIRVRGDGRPVRDLVRRAEPEPVRGPLGEPGHVELLLGSRGVRRRDRHRGPGQEIRIGEGPRRAVPNGIRRCGSHIPVIARCGPREDHVIVARAGRTQIRRACRGRRVRARSGGLDRDRLGGRAATTRGVRDREGRGEVASRGIGVLNRLPAAGSAVPEAPLIGRDRRTRVVVGGAPVKRNRVARDRVRGGEHERRHGRIGRERAGVRVVVVRPFPVVQEDHRGEGADASGDAPLRVVRPVAVAQRISDRARALPIAVFGLEVRRSQRVVPIAVDVDVRLVDVRFVHVLVRDLEARDVVEVEVEPPPPAGGARDELVVRGADRDQVVGAVRLHVGDEMTDPRPEGVDVADLTPVGIGLVPEIPHRDRRRAVVPLDDGSGQFQVVQVQRIRRVVHQVVRRDRVLAEDRHEVRVGSGCPVDHPIEKVPEARRVRLPVVVRHLHLPVVVHDPNSEEGHGRIVRIPHRAVVKDVAEVFAPELIRVRDVRNLRAGSVREDVVQAPDRGVGRRRGDDGPGERGRLVDAEQDDRLSVLHQLRPLGVDEPGRSHRLSHVGRNGYGGRVD